MQSRIEAFSVEPKLMQTLLKLEETVIASGLEKCLIELVKIRAWHQPARCRFFAR